MAKGTIEKRKRSSDYDSKFKNILPKDFQILDIVICGKKILVDMKQLLELANCENKQEIMSAMNKSSSQFYYFGRIRIELERELLNLEEKINIWLASKMSEFKDESSEKAKERCVMVGYADMYYSKKKKIEEVTILKKHADNAYKSIEKHIELLRSIGRIIISEDQKNSGKMNMPDNL